MLELHSRFAVDDAQRHAPSLVGRYTRPLVITSLVIFVVLTISVVAAAGPVLVIDKALSTWPSSYAKNSILGQLLAMVGQRAYSAPFLIVVAVFLSWRRRIVRPIVLALVGLLALNVVVGALKYTFARPSPRTGVWLPFSGGTDFPSGHTSNVVLTWGLLAWLVLAFGRKVPTIRRQWIGYGLVALASVTVGFGSLYLRTHWLSDIVAGWAIGFVILVGVTQLHKDATWRERLTRVEHSLFRFGRRSTDPAGAQSSRDARSPSAGTPLRRITP